jgi:hypothetical protein
MAQPELERRRSVSEYSALSGGDFQGIGSFDPMSGLGSSAGSSFRLPIIVSMSPTRLSLGIVASLQSPPPFHLAKPL